MDWSNCTGVEKINLLANHSTVYQGLLIENDELIELIRSGATFETCLEFVNENW